MNVLVLNAGSSTLKFQVIATDVDRMKQNTDQRFCRGQIERIGGEAIITVRAATGSGQKCTTPLRDMGAALDYVLQWLVSEHSGIPEIRSIEDIHAVRNGIVHGGEFFSESALITDQVLRESRTASISRPPQCKQHQRHYSCSQSAWAESPPGCRV
jgi:acetate kinase